MKKMSAHYLVLIGLIVGSMLLAGSAQAGNESMEAGKRKMFEDNSTETMRDVYTKREVESKEYKQRMLSNSEESVRLLKDIKVLLQQLNEKE